MFHVEETTFFSHGKIFFWLENLFFGLKFYIQEIGHFVFDLVLAKTLV